MKPNLETEYQKALKEIGTIEPWWSEEDGFYIFEHAAYPVVDYAADTLEETIQGYQRILKEWIVDRLAGNVADVAERITSGRGGARPGSGRPKGTVKNPTAVVRLPLKVAQWLKDPAHLAQVEKLMG
jgi:hypothetical protein